MIYQLFLITFLLTSCNENFTGGSRWETPQQQQNQVAPPPEDFTTRLNNILLIAGKQCLGDETTEPDGHGVQCEPRQYLIYIDNVNICDSSGRCTDFVVTPIIGELLDINAGIPDVSIFDIIPKSTVSAIQRDILETVKVKTDLFGNGTVFFSRD